MKNNNSNWITLNVIRPIEFLNVNLDNIEEIDLEEGFESNKVYYNDLNKEMRSFQVLQEQSDGSIKVLYREKIFDKEMKERTEEWNELVNKYEQANSLIWFSYKNADKIKALIKIKDFGKKII